MVKSAVSRKWGAEAAVANQLPLQLAAYKEFDNGLNVSRLSDSLGRLYLPW